MKDKDLFLLGLFRQRLEYPTLKCAMREQQSLFGATSIPDAAMERAIDAKMSAGWISPQSKAGENPDRTAGSSIYPALQNMLLAMRALGLGTTLMTRHGTVNLVAPGVLARVDRGE